MKSSNNEGERVPTDDLLLPHKVCSPGTGLCPFELLPKRVTWKYSNNQRNCQTKINKAMYSV